jgi:hypothetical protein
MSANSIDQSYDIIITCEQILNTEPIPNLNNNNKKTDNYPYICGLLPIDYIISELRKSLLSSRIQNIYVVTSQINSEKYLKWYVPM